MSSALDLIAIRNILTLRYHPNSDGKLTIADFAADQITLEDAASMLEQLLNDEVSQLLDNVRKAAIAMGNGIDSALILATVRESMPDIELVGISMGFDEWKDETIAATKLADVMGVDCFAIYKDNLLADLPMHISIIKEPRWNTYFYHVASQLRHFGLKTLLTGDGGDEIFGGYTFRYKKFLDLIEPGISLKPEITAKQRVECYLACHVRDWVDDQPLLFQDTRIKFDWQDVHKMLRPYFDNDADPLDQLMLADFNGKLLHDFIPTSRKICAAMSVDLVAPFLDLDIIKLGTHLPSHLKYDVASDTGKLLLRSLLARRRLTQYITPVKSGFGPDPMKVYERHGYEICKTWLAPESARIVKEKLVNPAWLRKYVGFHAVDVRVVNKLLMLLALEVYCRLFVTGEMKSHDKL